MILLLAFIILILNCIFLKRISLFFNLIDSPDKIRKLHKQKAYLVGGIYFIPLLPLLLIEIGLENKLIIFYLSYAVITIILGFYDDLRKVNILHRLLIFNLLSIIFITFIITYNNHNGESFTFLNQIYKLTNLEAVILYSFIIFTFSNILNFTDGVDALITNICMIFLNYLIFLFNINIFILILSILYHAIFIFFNIRNKYFLGSSGIIFFTITISILFKILHQFNKITIEELLLFFEFITLDFVFVIFHRLVNKQKPWIGDRNHLHFKILNLFKNIFTLNLFYMALSILPLILYKFSILDFKSLFVVIFSIYLISRYLINLKTPATLRKNIY